jgi:transposase
MANRLRVAEIHSIVTLYERGWSCRRIARELGVHRETVGNYVRRGWDPPGPDLATARPSPTGDLEGVGAKPAKAPIGSGALAASKPAKAPTGSFGGEPATPGNASTEMDASRSASIAGEAPPGRFGADAPTGAPPRSMSACRAHHAAIVAGVELGLSAMRIWQDLREQHPADLADNADTAAVIPSYYSVRRYARALRRVCEPPMRRMECEPGVEAQVDFGTGAPLIDQHGRKRRTHVLRIVLSHSRKGYSEAVYRQTTEEFIRCIENAFHHFGGVPGTLVLDNLKAAVSKADWFDPEINPKVQSFCRHYGIVALPTKPRTPRHKGKIERGIGYVKDNGLKGHVFTTLAEQNEHLLRWETTVADRRIHGTTKRQVGEVFEAIERPVLRPLPPARFPSFTEGQRIVSRDGHVEVAKAYYSVPPEYLGRTVWARWDARTVRIFDSRMQQIALHVRGEPGRFRTDDRHILDRKISGVERGAAWLLKKAQRIGAEAARWAQAMVTERGIEGVRVLQGLISLANKHPFDSINRACEIALSHGAFRLRTIRQLIHRGADRADEQSDLPGFIDEHPIIRSLADYGRLVHDAFSQPLHGAIA